MQLDAITFDEYNANGMLNARMAEYTKAVVDGRRTSIFRSSWTFPRTAIAIERMIRRFCRISACCVVFDPLALDQACVDACLAANPMPNSQLSDNLKKPGFADWGDPFKRIPRRNPNGAVALTTPRRLAWVTVV